MRTATDLFFCDKSANLKHPIPHLPRHLTFFSVVSSPGIFCVFGDKSAWEKKCLQTRFAGFRILCRPGGRPAKDLPECDYSTNIQPI